MRIFSTRLVTCLTLILLPTIVLSGCDSDGNDDDESTVGSFSAEITGDGIDEELDGLAWFGEYEDDEIGEEGFVIWMSASQANMAGQTVGLITVSDRPGTGTYPIVNFVDEDFEDIPAGSFAAVAYGGSSAYYVSTGGSLTLTTSSSNRVAGTYSFTARGGTIVDDELVETDVTVQGTFNAVGGSTFNIPGL